MLQSVVHPTALRVFLFISLTLNLALGFRLHRANTSKRRASSPNIVQTLNVVSVKDLSGRAVTIDLRSGSPMTVLYVYTPSCRWCDKNLENIKQMALHTSANGAAKVIGLSLSRDGLKQYVEKNNLGFPTYTDLPSDFMKMYHVGATPHTPVVKDGRIVRDWRGAYTGALQQEIEQYFHARLPGLQE